MAEEAPVEDNSKTKWNLSHFMQNTPCVRSSLMLGIGGGLGVGMVSFLYSKRVKRSCDIAVGTFLVSSLTSWSYCYYTRYEQFQNMETIVKTLEKRNQKVKEITTQKKTEES